MQSCSNGKTGHREGLARICSAIAGFRVQSANRHTTRPDGNILHGSTFGGSLAHGMKFGGPIASGLLGKGADLGSLLGGACLEIAVMHRMPQGELGTQDKV